MIETIDVRVDPRTAATPLLLQSLLSTRLNIDVNRIKSICIVRRSIDARQRNIFINLSLKVFIDEEERGNSLLNKIEYPNVSGSRSVIIVGAGPAGMFAALRLIELGFKPIILERGKDVDSRRIDMAKISRENIVDSDSNYCFGEGGAGAFSDGKLYTRSKKRGNVEKILQVFVQHGASEDILVDAHPHIGTDRLPKVIKAMRETIISAGGEIHFGTRVTDFIYKGSNIEGVLTANGESFYGPVILAIGHSARDTYRMLQNRAIELQPKGLAIGVRLEHPQDLIDKIQYHNPNGRGKYLPAAEYSMLTRVNDRAVYSFCMCPGGFIIPSASGPDQQAVNGMSPSNRSTKWANSGMVVEILPDDVTEFEGNLKMLHLQEKIERTFFEESNKTQNAPAQRMTDFVEARMSKSIEPTSYAPGVHCARVDKLLPEFISTRLRQGFKDFGKKYKGFLSDKATVIGCETRTSSPVRILRDSQTLSSVSHQMVFPAGEGAGYAGGIVSAGVDGERAAEAVAAYISSNS